METIEYNVELVGEITQNDIDQEIQLMDKLAKVGMHFIEAAKLLSNYRAHEMLVTILETKRTVTMRDVLEIQNATFECV